MIATTTEHLQPRHSSILAENTEEKEDEETLKSIEDHEEDLESNGSCSTSESSDSECTKEPRQTKEGHDTCNTDDQSDDSFLVHLFFGTTKCFPSVLDEDADHHDKDDNIKDQDGKDGAQEGTKEYCRIRDKATTGRKRTKPSTM